MISRDGTTVSMMSSEQKVVGAFVLPNSDVLIGFLEPVTWAAGNINNPTLHRPTLIRSLTNIFPIPSGVAGPQGQRHIEPVPVVLPSLIELPIAKLTVYSYVACGMVKEGEYLFETFTNYLAKQDADRVKYEELQSVHKQAPLRTV